MVGEQVVLVEITVDMGTATLTLAACFSPPASDHEQEAFWRDFHCGLLAAVKAKWQPDWKWHGSESVLQPYVVTPGNLENVRRALSHRRDSADRWQAVVGLEAVLQVGTRYKLGGESDGPTA